jgi:addiction module HigA family antidote
MQLNFENEYAPDVVSAPGETLQEILEERGMTQTELADRLGLAHKTVNEIIRGKAPLTHETALALEIVLGIPAGFWNTYETTYRESLARKEGVQKLSASANWLDIMPWRKAVDMGWIRLRSTHSEQIIEILRFFGVASPKQYEEVYGNLAVQWKRSSRFQVDPHATAFWLRRGELLAMKLAQTSGMVWNEYDPREFERCLIDTRTLTRDREPKSFVPALQRRCALAGVAVVFVPELEGTRAGGATRWLSPVRALIQLSLRYKTNDHLWFIFYHEGAHILKHSKKRLFLEYDGKEQDDLQEKEANEFAQNILIPPREYSLLLRSGKPSKAGVEAFAERIGVDPGIVVGRLQNENKILRDRFNDLKQRYEWEFIEGE